MSSEIVEKEVESENKVEQEEADAKSETTEQVAPDSENGSMQKSDKEAANGSAPEDKLADSEKTAENIASRVHSANDWEHADLGDENRKEKFLKLMGASKAEHTGKIVIGDQKPQHKGDDPEQMNKNLETQFQHGLEHKLKGGYKHHTGLGFSEEPKAKESEAGDGGEVKATPDSDVVEERLRVNEETADKSVEKRKIDSSDSNETSPKKKPMMNFVKASGDN